MFKWIRAECPFHGGLLVEIFIEDCAVKEIEYSFFVEGRGIKEHFQTNMVSLTLNVSSTVDKGSTEELASCRASLVLENVPYLSPVE